MLQQTRVDLMRSCFQRFMQRFPTIAARQRRRMKVGVVGNWPGHYAQARNLQTAAADIVTNTAASSRAIKTVQALPGIGPYTAGAILSIARSAGSAARWQRDPSPVAAALLVESPDTGGQTALLGAGGGAPCRLVAAC